MKTQEEYALEIDEIVRRDVESCQSDWFIIDKEIFMQPENKNKAFILGTRKTGCDMIVLGGTNCSGSNIDRLFGCLDNENFYVCQPLSFYKSQQEIEKVNPLYAFKLATAYFRGQGMVPVFEIDKTMSIKVIRYRLPSYWACPLINDDYTGLTDEECEEIQRFLEAAEGYPVDVDLETQGFYHCNDAGTLPGECADFIFHKCND